VSPRLELKARTDAIRVPTRSSLAVGLVVGLVGARRLPFVTSSVSSSRPPTLPAVVASDCPPRLPVTAHAAAHKSQEHLSFSNPRESHGPPSPEDGERARPPVSDPTSDTPTGVPRATRERIFGVGCAASVGRRPHRLESEIMYLVPGIGSLGRACTTQGTGRFRCPKSHRPSSKR
jgi:hypothetical protein